MIATPFLCSHTHSAAFSVASAAFLAASPAFWAVFWVVSAVLPDFAAAYCRLIACFCCHLEAGLLVGFSISAYFW